MRAAFLYHHKTTYVHTNTHRARTKPGERACMPTFTYQHTTYILYIHTRDMLPPRVVSRDRARASCPYINIYSLHSEFCAIARACVWRACVCARARSKLPIREQNHSVMPVCGAARETQIARLSSACVFAVCGCCWWWLLVGFEAIGPVVGVSVWSGRGQQSAIMCVCECVLVACAIRSQRHIILS